MIKELHVSKNLFDAATAVKGRISATTGAIEYSEDTTTFTYDSTNNEFTITTTWAWRGFVSDYIDVQEFLRLSCVSDKTLYQFEYAYDSNKAFLGRVTADNIPTGIRYIRVSFQFGEVVTNAKIKNIMLNTGQTALPYEPYGDTWNTKSYAKIVDTTQQVTSFPVVVRPMENVIPSWTIKGNMSQSGTPTPQNPIQPQGTGERTGNLFDGTVSGTNKRIAISTGGSYNSNGYSISEYIPIDGNTNYIINTTYSSYFAIYDSNKNYIYGEEIKTTKPIPATYTNARFVRFDFKTVDKDSIMFNKGLQSLPYEPYGIKIPISSASTTTPVYLGEVQTTRKVKKLVLTGQEDWRELTSDTTKHYLVSLDSDYLRAENQITYICSHYVAFGQTSSATSVPNLQFSFAYSTTAQRLYIADATYTTNDAWKSYLAAQYAAGTPVCVWYVLATSQTAVVNEPLRKIGTYADSVSGTNLSVTAHSPTTIDVDTSLKPSEMDLTYTGTKMCKRKKRVNGAWV